MEFSLRPWQQDDVSNLVEAANNQNIAVFMTNQFPHPYMEEDALKFIEMASSRKPCSIFAIIVKGKAVGGIGLHPQSDLYCKNMELGYWLAEPFWGKGIVSEAVQQMVSYGFNNFDINRIFARPFGNNIASQKVLKKAGFKLEAFMEKAFFKNGEYLDEMIFAIRNN
ncbi:MAG: GNAT family protein [Chitinophagaceae bacterium]